MAQARIFREISLSHLKVLKEVPALKIFMKFKYVTPPRKANPKAAGFDLFFSQDYLLKGGLTKIPMGFGIQLPTGHMGLLKMRSSAASKGLSIEGGVIDESFDPRQEVFALINNKADHSIEVRQGEAAIQLIILPLPQVSLEVQGPYEPKEDEGAEDTNAGLGSTGNEIKSPSIILARVDLTEPHEYLLRSKAAKN